MAIKRVIIVLITITVLVGCASKDTYRRSVDTWIGSSETELLKSWGKPVNSYSQGNSKFLMYNETGPSNNFSGYKNAVVDTGDCNTTFQIIDNIIIESTFEGSSCRAW